MCLSVQRWRRSVVTLGGERGLGTGGCCWSRGQGWLELGNFSKRSLWVPSCFLGSNAEGLIKLPSLSPGKEGSDEPTLCWELVSP